MGEKKQFTCKNPSCKTTFTTALKTLNFQENPAEPYFACPFCLTRIEEDTPVRNQNSEVLQEKGEAEEPRFKQDSKRTGEKNISCKFHLGYLSERTQKEQIPDDCLVCKEIVLCMLKKMRGE
jgi:hypothetical protein